MTESDVVLTLLIVAAVAFGVTRVSPHFGHSRGAILAIAVLVIAGAIALLLSTSFHPPMVEASGVLHE